MAITAFKYGQFLVNALTGNVDWTTDTVRVALLTDAYVPDQDNHNVWSDVSANETSGTGYTAGGEILANATITYDAPSNTITLDGDDVVWPDSTISAQYAIVYVDNATKPLAGYVDFGEIKASDNGTFQVTWNASGIYTITVD